MAHYDDDPKKPNQLPDGDLGDAAKKHDESDFNDDDDDSDEDDENSLETPDDDTSDFE